MNRQEFADLLEVLGKIAHTWYCSIGNPIGWREYRKQRAKVMDEFDSLKREVGELLHALESSRQYADKLVNGIPYLPADFENAKKANWDFAIENNNLKKSMSTLLRILEDHGSQIIKSHSSEIKEAKKLLGNYDDYFLRVSIVKGGDNPLSIPEGIEFYPDGAIVSDKK